MTHPDLCPVCQGRGLVVQGFYENVEAVSVDRELCRSCRGQGYIWPTLLINVTDWYNGVVLGSQPKWGLPEAAAR